MLKLGGMAVGGLLKEFVDVGAARQLGGGVLEQLAQIEAALIGCHLVFTSTVRGLC